jgi:hypothetical protein
MPKQKQNKIKRESPLISRRKFTAGSIALMGAYTAFGSHKSPVSTAGTKAPSGNVTVRVLNPVGEIEPPPTFGLNPRLSDLNGKTIALMDNWKAGGVYLQDRFEQLLKKKYPNVKVLRTTKPEGREGGGRLIFSADNWYPEVANKADAFIYTIAD